MSYSGNRRQEPWRANERHYCAICNSWMGSDRQSIMIHENGKKHRENMEASLKKRRDDKLQSEKDKQFIASSLKKMEKVAAMAHLNDVASGSFYSGSVSLDANMTINQGDVQNITSKESTATTEKKSWQSRKEKRKSDDINNSNSYHDTLCVETKRPKITRELGPDEGHYVIDSKTYLEGSVYYPIFEEDMPVQIWIGSDTMSYEYRKTHEGMSLWKTGIILKVHQINDDTDTNNNCTCDIAYLKDVNDDDETIEKRVKMDRLRLILGSDDLIPQTIEESRLQLLGGEEIINVDDGQYEVDENTGLSTFRTVSVRKVTVSQEVKEERSRARAKRREEIEREKNKMKEIEARQMEEAKHANADDSALGAYDVWGRGGYKGINIQAEVKLDVADTAKSLSEGKTNIVFKKSTFKKGTKKQNRRKTFADSDEE